MHSDIVHVLDLYVSLGAEHHCSHWYSLIQNFRQGNYNNAKTVVQIAWKQFCENILVQVNKNWKNKIVRANTLMSDVCSVSDEAFAYQVARTNIFFWMKKIHTRKTNNVLGGPVNRNQQVDDIVSPLKNGDHLEDVINNEGDDDDGDYGNLVDGIMEGSNVDNAKDEGELEEAKDKINIKAYYACHSALSKLKRENREDWISWDEGFKESISIPLQSLPQGIQREMVAMQPMNNENEVEIEYEIWC